MKFEKHDSPASSTQESIKPVQDGPGRPKVYRDGADVHKGKISKDPLGEAPASQPRKQTY